MANIFILSIVVIVILHHHKASCDEEMVNMKIVDEPTNSFAWSAGQNVGMEAYQQTHLMARVKPANVSGPALFHRFHGKCFTVNISLYEYSFCPFANITQRELSNTWMPYHGILGVWQEWEITNYTFSAQIYRDGNDCGRIQRSAKVTFTCGRTEQILNVTEPTTCQYHLSFMTRLACHRDTLLVYPTLSDSHQHRWDELETRLHDNHLTQQGYNKQLRLILEDAGYLLSPSLYKDLVRDAHKQQLSSFASLAECKLEYEKLHAEVLELRPRLASTTEHTIGIE